MREVCMPICGGGVMSAVLFPAWRFGFLCGEYFPAPLAPHPLRYAFSYVVMCLFCAAIGSCNHCSFNDPRARASDLIIRRNRYALRPCGTIGLRQEGWTAERKVARRGWPLSCGSGHPENCGKAGESSIFDKNIAGKSVYYFMKITENDIDFFISVMKHPGAFATSKKSSTILTAESRPIIPALKQSSRRRGRRTSHAGYGSSTSQPIFSRRALATLSFTARK